MYASSMLELGRFEVPKEKFGRKVENWIPEIVYIPEPPVLTRGAMNPWALERQRVLYREEEKAWRQIQELQREWASLESKLSQLAIQYNQIVDAINERLADLGSGTTLQKMQTYTGFLSFTPFTFLAKGFMIAGLVERAIDLAFGITKKKKKDLENWIRELQRVEAEISATYQRMQAVMGEVEYWLGVSDRVKSQQAAVMAFDIQQSEARYLDRQAAEQRAAAVQQARARSARMLRPERIIDDSL